MRINRIEAYFIDLLVIFIIYGFVNYLLPQSEKLKKYKAQEYEVQEKFNHQEMKPSEYIKKYEVIYYNINNEKKVSNAIYLLLLIVYFVILPFYLNGQTLGLFIKRLRIERFTDGPLHLYQFFVRNVIIVGLGYTFLNTILIYFLNANTYYKTVFVVSIIQILLRKSNDLPSLEGRCPKGIVER